jgi:hypothetical protein
LVPPTNTMYFTDRPAVVIYGNHTCSGEPKGVTPLSTVCADNQDDDDHFLVPFLQPPEAGRADNWMGTSNERKGESTGVLGTVAVTAMKRDERSPGVHSRLAYGSSYTDPTDSAEDANYLTLASIVGYYGTGTKYSVSTHGVCTSPPSDDDDSSAHPSRGLSAGATVSIVLGSVVGAGTAVVLVYNALINKRKQILVCWWW